MPVLRKLRDSLADSGLWSSAVDTDPAAVEKWGRTAVCGAYLFESSANTLGTIRHSIDNGQNWTNVINQFAVDGTDKGQVLTFHFDGVYYYAGTELGKLFRSQPPFTSWTSVDSGAFGTDDLVAACFNGGVHCIAARSLSIGTVKGAGSGAGGIGEADCIKALYKVYTSPDGLTWTVRTTGLESMDQMDDLRLKPYGATGFAALLLRYANYGKMNLHFIASVTENLTSWSLIGSGAMSANTGANDPFTWAVLPALKWIAIFSNRVYISSVNGTAWTIQTTLAAGDMFVASGVHNDAIYRVKMTMAGGKKYTTEYSINGTTWIPATPRDKFLTTFDAYVLANQSIASYLFNMAQPVATPIVDLEAVYPASVVVNGTAATGYLLPAIWDGRGRKMVRHSSGQSDRWDTTSVITEEIASYSFFARREDSSYESCAGGQWTDATNAGSWAVTEDGTGKFPAITRSAAPANGLVHLSPNVDTPVTSYVFVTVQWDDSIGELAMYINGVKQTMTSAINVFAYTRNKIFQLASVQSNAGASTFNRTVIGYHEYAVLMQRPLSVEEMKFMTQLLIENDILGVIGKKTLPFRPTMSGALTFTDSNYTVEKTVVDANPEHAIVLAPMRTGSFGFKVTWVSGGSGLDISIGVSRYITLTGGQKEIGISPTTWGFRFDGNKVNNAVVAAVVGSGAVLVTQSAWIYYNSTNRNLYVKRAADAAPVLMYTLPVGQSLMPCVSVKNGAKVTLAYDTMYTGYEAWHVQEPKRGFHFVDTFQYANQDPLLGVAPADPDYDLANGAGARMAGNLVIADTISGDRVLLKDYSIAANQYAECRLSVINGTDGVVLRDGLNGRYLVQVLGTGALRISHQTFAGVQTTLSTTGAGVYVANALLRVEISGMNVTVYVNGVSVHTYTIVNPYDDNAKGRIGFWLVGAGRLSYFAGGDLVS